MKAFRREVVFRARIRMFRLVEKKGLLKFNIRERVELMLKLVTVMCVRSVSRSFIRSV